MLCAPVHTGYKDGIFNPSTSLQTADSKKYWIHFNLVSDGNNSTKVGTKGYQRGKPVPGLTKKCDMP